MSYFIYDKMGGANDGHSSLLVNMNDESALAQFESMDLGLVPVNGIVQPPVIPPVDKPHRNTDSLQYVLKTVVKAVSEHKFAWPFMLPVNAVELEIPDYHRFIKYPMDITTIRKRLENCYYYDVTECIKDFQMIFYNCYRYNRAGEEIVLMAQIIEKVFVEKMQDCPKETWTDFKGTVKCIVAAILKHQSATGGGSPTQEYLSPLYEKAANSIGKDLIQGDTNALVSDRELKINSPMASTSHDAASQDSVTKNTEQQQPQERISPRPTNTSNLEDLTSEAKTSNKTPKSKRSKKKNPYYTTEDRHLMVGADKDNANTINRLASTIKEKNIIEAEKNEILKKRNEIETQKLEAFNKFTDIFHSFINR